MALYRCAACGSPNVVKDTQKDGIRYDYLKGAAGTVLLGAGGAVAGITSQSTEVFKCPDCGVTLSYSMPQNIKMAIDMGVMDENARYRLEINGLRIDWNVLTQSYKNIESGFADERINRRRENNRSSVLACATATQEEFDAALDLVVQYNHDLVFDDKGHYRTTPISLTEYMAYHSAVATVIENVAKYIPSPMPSGFTYRGFEFDRDRLPCGSARKGEFKQLFYTYLHEKIREKFGSVILKMADEDMYEDYAFIDPFIDAFAETYFPDEEHNSFGILTPPERWEDMIRDAGERLLGFRPIGYHYADLCGFKVCDRYAKVVIPRFTVKDGRLGYHYASGRHKNGLPSEILFEHYFTVFPEKRKIYEDKIAAFQTAEEENEKKEKQLQEKIGALQNEVKINENRVSVKEKEIEQLQRKIFGKKSALARIDVLSEEIRAIKETLSSKNEEISTTQTELDSIPRVDKRKFAEDLVKEMDYFVVWYWVDETGEGAQYFAD